MGVIETFVSPVRVERAIDIMADNTFGVDDAVKAFKLNPSVPQLSALSQVPYTENTLLECKDTHFLAAVFPLSIINIHDLFADGDNGRIFSSNFWYRREPFALNPGETMWRLFRKAPIPNTFLKTLEEHLSIFLPQDEEIPKVRRLVYAMVARYITTGERLFENAYVRCADRDAFGVRLAVSGIGAEGLSITNEFGNKRNKNLCLASARKFDHF